ncbi:metallophosphoesterase [Pseudobacteroides cellulosolvens]|uniref:Metallophosphoesterase n=1 Tax=Pseudobacteroides cellulosolvens ATCC 35603 = DSM 2933 TaxID=398512 RepID=A0A0L6JHD8_9FIRM|nr:metallophosphoesterase [Pseudobacteroides cellulosolvens]KNY25251.1 metallophosphoesterase [Pseudobacteroides cellulosolvens ATCC 35603 = DSM 2933]
MKTVFRKSTSILLILALVLGQTIVSWSIDDAANVPKQITISATTMPSKVLNFTWTVKDTKLTTKNVLQVMEKSLSSEFDPIKAVKFQATARKGYNMPGKLVIKATAKNLKPDTEYLYRVGNETANVWSEGSFKTIVDSSKDSEISFVFIADPQIDGIDSKAASVSFEKVFNKYPDSSFTYVAGDFTEEGPNEVQWEGLFNGGGLYPNAGQKLFANTITVGTQGNHDWAGLDNHFSFPAINGLSNVYSFDAGPVHFIVLNTNYCDNNVSAFQKEMEWLEQDVKGTQKPWKIVLAHKPPYSGGLNINYEPDMKFLRQNLVPVLTRLGIDALLGGHDHTYSRGFVDLKGYNVKSSMLDKETAVQPKTFDNNGKEYTPVLFVGNCTSGASKWYPAGYYNADPDDPIAKNYAFLEKSSAGFSNRYQYQAYTKVSVSDNKLSFITEMFHYDLNTDKITKEPFVYEKYSVVKRSSSASQNPSPIITSASTPTRPPTKTPTPTNTPAIPTGDFNNDGIINMADVINLARRFNKVKGDQTYNLAYDLKNDGVINMADVLIMASKFNKTI